MLKTKSGALVDQIEALLTGSTGAGENVIVALSWPQTVASLPAILIDPVYTEHRESLGRNAPQFTTVTTIKIHARVTSPDGPDNSGAQAVQDALETLKSQIERNLINAYPLMLQIQQFPAIDTEFDISADAKQPVGELTMTIAMEFYEGPEDFAPIDTAPLTNIKIYTDLQNVFDALGTYVGLTPFPQSVVPAPRTSGPDGRLEGGGVDIVLPQ